MADDIYMYFTCPYVLYIAKQINGVLAPPRVYEHIVKKPSWVAWRDAALSLYRRHRDPSLSEAAPQSCSPCWQTRLDSRLQTDNRTIEPDNQWNERENRTIEPDSKAKQQANRTRLTIELNQTIISTCSRIQVNMSTLHCIDCDWVRYLVTCSFQTGLVRTGNHDCGTVAPTVVACTAICLCL